MRLVFGDKFSRIFKLNTGQLAIVDWGDTLYLGMPDEKLGSPKKFERFSQVKKHLAEIELKHKNKRLLK